MNLRDESGRLIRLGSTIGEAGEGRVHTIEGSTTHVAKVYKTPPDEERIAKLRSQIANSPPALREVTAWPERLLFDDETGQVAGFQMQRIDARPIHHLYRPRDRRTHFPRATWTFLLHVARNLAAAFETLHENGVLMADVNEGNVFVTADGLVRLIDCDSYQVSNPGGGCFLCKVGTAIWTPPEMQGRDFTTSPRTIEHDRFGLAVLLFHLLLMGRHPYAGVPTDLSRVNDQWTLDEAIARHQFAYSRARPPAGVRAPRGTLSAEALPPGIFGLFENAFSPEPGARPGGREWSDAVARVQNPRRCPRNPAHEFGTHLSTCPWCHIHIQEGGPDYFVIPGLAGARQVGIHEIDMAWNEWISARPLDIEVLSFQAPHALHVTGKPMPMPLTRGKRAIGRWTYKCLKTLGLSPYGTLNPAYVLERDRRKRSWDGAVSHVESLISSRNTHAAEYRRQFDSLLQTRHPVLLAAWRRIHLIHARRVHESKATAQLDAFLDGKRLTDSTIPGIGPREHVILGEFGIESALDVREGVFRGNLAPDLKSRLRSWLADCEERFRRASSDQGEPPVQNEMPLDDLCQSFQKQIADSLSIVAGLAAEVRMKIAHIDAQLATMMDTLAQAQADYAAAYHIRG